MRTPRAQRLAHQWDASADPYDRHTRRYPSHRQITSLLLSTTTDAPRSVLDFGCGPGNSSRLLRRWFPDAHVVGLDTSQPMIDMAEGTTPPDEKIEYRCQDVSAYRADGQRHDLIVCSNSFFQGGRPQHVGR
jgi:trans-aconitate methyltransferase